LQGTVFSQVAIISALKGFSPSIFEEYQSKLRKAFRGTVTTHPIDILFDHILLSLDQRVLQNLEEVDRSGPGNIRMHSDDLLTLRWLTYTAVAAEFIRTCENYAISNMAIQQISSNCSPHDMIAQSFGRFDIVINRKDELEWQQKVVWNEQLGTNFSESLNYLKRMLKKCFLAYTCEGPSSFFEQAHATIISTASDICSKYGYEAFCDKLQEFHDNFGGYVSVYFEDVIRGFQNNFVEGLDSAFNQLKLVIQNPTSFTAIFSVLIRKGLGELLQSLFSTLIFINYVMNFYDYGLSWADITHLKDKVVTKVRGKTVITSLYLFSPN
jgi:hypothetical protein